MNSSTVSSFFSRDTLLKRQARIRRKARPSPLKQPLHIIPELSEEDEPRHSAASSSSFSSSQSFSRTNQVSYVKAKRRHANINPSDIRIAKDLFSHHDEHTADFSLLYVPRPAPLPPTSPSDRRSSRHISTPSSQRSVQVTFAEMGPGISLDFPCPPLPTPSSIERHGYESPTPSLSTSSVSSGSPSSQSVGLPTTPQSSDDEFFQASPSRPSHVPVRPLVIAKHTPSSCTSCELDISVYTSPELLQPFKTPDELQSSSSVNQPSPEPDSDSEEASNWYAREFSDILTLYSPLPSSFPLPPSRRDSMPAHQIQTDDLPPSPTPYPRRSRLSIRRSSELSCAFPSAQLDPAFPRRYHSIPKRPPPPPPPVPPIPEHLRPPPRMSVPDDFDFFIDAYSDDLASPNTPSSGSVYSQDSPEIYDDVQFDVEVQFDLDLDVPMRLPLSLPNSPIDLEADIAQGLEELRQKAEQLPPRPDSPAENMFADDERTPGDLNSRVLRSRWSSSTLSSLTDERPSPSSKLRSYFSGSKKSSRTSRGRKGSIASPPPTPLSPISPSPKSHHFGRGSYRDSDIMVIGSGYGNVGVKRRGSSSGSSCAGSDTGSCESSGSSSGLRRKPIPVEMFLRNA